MASLTVCGHSGSLSHGHLAAGLDPMLQTVQLPAGITHLDASLADVDADTFTLETQAKRYSTREHVA